MYRTDKNELASQVEDVFVMVEKNVSCTKSVIDHIDNLIEQKPLHESIHNALTELRNICAINVMNLARVNKP